MKPDRVMDGRIQVSDAAIELALTRLKSRLEHALFKHKRGSFVSPHETIGALTEEFDEAKAAAKANDVEAFGDELLDIATVAVFGEASRLAANTEQKVPERPSV